MRQRWVDAPTPPETTQSTDGPTSPLKVLHVLNSAMPSGAEVMLATAAAHWADRNIDCDLAERGVSGPFSPVLRQEGYRIHDVRASPPQATLTDLWRTVRRGGFDVVHVHTEYANFWLVLVGLAAGARVVRTVHACYPFYGGLRRERTVQRRLLRQLGVRTVAVSREVARHEAQAFRNKAVVVTNWVDSQRFRPPAPDERNAARRALGLADNRPVLLTIGNCAPVKRHEFVLRAIESVPHAQYIHIGHEAPDASERRLAHELGVDSRTTFVGPVSDVRPYLWAADLFLMPSAREGSSLALAEALCSGIPCAVGDHPSLLETTGGEEAFHFGSPEQLAAALGPVTRADLREWRARSQTSADGFRIRFSPDRGVDDYATIYRAVLGRRTSQESC
ncbi:MAG: glycosyltransferase [Actinobacteria bacterium]|nr:glycosyltransferase [Actinomycetota bacterium]